MTEQEIEINNENIVSINDLNKILEISDLRNTCVSIFFQNEIAKFDIAFIAGLYLLHSNLNSSFKISYSGTIQDNRIFEVRQYIKQLEDLFGIKFNTICNSFKAINNISTGDFVASTSFVPIILVNEQTYKDYFQTKLSNHNSNNPLIELSNKYVSTVKVSNQKEKDYFESKDSIYKELQEYPPLHTMIFTILYHKINPFVSSAVKGIDDSPKRTKQLWEFTKEYVKGLDELAKNIKDHSSTGNGMITIRAYDKEEDKIANGKVLQTHVFDFGDTGIIDKLKKSTNDNVGTNKIYEVDLQILDNNYSLENFINPSVENKLNQQLYRDIAHYGLTKFYKLIQTNEGTIVSSTHSNTLQNNRDVFQSTNKSFSPISIGTNYFFELPFKPELFRNSNQQSANETSFQGTAQTIGGLSKILKYSLINDINDLTDQTDIIFNLNPKTTNVGNREDEKKLCDEIESLKIKSFLKYIAINMKGIELSASSLLRFLAHISSNFNQSIILYNIDFEKYNEMITDNKLFYSSVKDLNNEIPYWYDSKSVLVFSTIVEPNYHFSDILFGKNEDEFNSINQIVSHTFPNTNTILNKKVANDSSFNIPKCLTPFFHQSALLPFDILLTDKESNSLFQSNLSSILGNHIQKV